MDALRKQASRFREQVAKQQQAVIKQLSGTGYESSDVMVTDEVELQRHYQLEKLYRSTRAGKDFQKDIVRAGEAFTVATCKHIEIGTKLAEDCSKFGAENANSGNLGRATSLYGEACVHVAKEMQDFNRVLSSQVLEPLRAMITGASLEDARHLAQRYSRMRQEAEAQGAEISRRQLRVKELPSADNHAKLQLAEAKMRELKSNMAVLGKEAAAALAAVESQQQRLTFQRLVSMVEAEKTFYQRAAAVLDEVEAEMISEKQRKDSVPPEPPSVSTSASEKALYFLAEVMHAFNAECEKELSLAVGDFVVVRKVTSSGWSEGECKGKAGWFPSSYVDKRHQIPNSKVVTEVF